MSLKAQCASVPSSGKICGDVQQALCTGTEQSDESVGMAAVPLRWQNAFGATCPLLTAETCKNIMARIARRIAETRKYMSTCSVRHVIRWVAT